MKLFKKMEGQIDSHVQGPHFLEHMGRSGDNVSQTQSNYGNQCGVCLEM